ncbi:hypothetical protein QTP86_028871, partial [Hemibagrus guttatus]
YVLSLNLSSTWFERVSMLVILLNCVTLGMFQPCQDLECHSERCTILEAFDDFIFAFFAAEMVLKMVALGVFGPKCYLGDTWNRLDLFIVMAGMLEYSLDGHNVSFSAIRTVRVLRPLRAINRVPSMRILVTLLLDTLPMLGNVLLLCFFVFFIFGIVGVQLWAGLLRNRCFLDEDVRTLNSFVLLFSPAFSWWIALSVYSHGIHFPGERLCLVSVFYFQRILPTGTELKMYNLSPSLSAYYRPEDSDDIAFICSTNCENGMLRCSDVPPRKVGGAYCELNVRNVTDTSPLDPAYRGCVNWNAYYNNCRASEHNPHNGAINFDNIGYAWIAIFQVITLEGWVDIMYYVMDAHSFYNFIYFIFLIIVGSFFMINLCLVVIATQFSETKQRENQLMREQRARFRSNESTLTSLAEPGSCYEEILNYFCHLLRKFYRHLIHFYNDVCRKSKSANLGESAAVGGANGHWSNKEKIELTRHLFHHHHHRVGNGTDVPDMKPVLLRGDKCLPTYASSFPLTVHSLKGIRVNYPTILPLAFFTHSRVDPGCTTALKTKNSNNKTQHGVYPGVCSSVCAEAGSRPTPCEFPTCPLSAREADALSSNSACDSDSEKESDTEVKKSSWESERNFSQKPRKQNVLGVCVRCVRAVLRRIVDSKYFNRGIMIAILINTLSMGVEYHEQPAELTDVLEISNIVFTSLFALEMVLKLLACGLLGYISNPYNIFDLIIVIIRQDVWELIGQADGGLSVLRTFRLLRVLKLVRFLPALRRQLVVLMKTMDNVATFCMLLMLFIFIFSILGMHLFGCKFTLRLENGDTISDRKNFDSLLWAIVTVFQILTQEDWNVVLYNGMASTSPWAALYFVALMTFGNYVLFNLLVAILVEGFQAEGDASRSESDDDGFSSDIDDEDRFRELLSSGSDVKVQTLLPISNGHLEPRATMPPYHAYTTATPRTEVSHVDNQSLRSSNASYEHHDQRSMSSLWGSRRSSWNSLGHAPSLKRRGQSGEHESLLSGDRDSFEDDQSEEEKSSRTGSLSRVSHLESFDLPELLQVPPMPHLYGECNGRLDGSFPSSPYTTQRETSHAPAEQDEDTEESWCVILKRILEPYKPQWCRDHEDWSLYVFSPQNKFRVRCQKVITHRLFDHIVLVFIFLNCITIALERPDIQPHSMVVAMGMYVGPGSYLQSSWNVLDGLLVFVSIVDILVSLASSGGNRILGILRVLRLLRTLRPLRVISRAPGLKLVVETLITSLRPIGNIVLICCAFFIVFGILGVQLFKGKFYHCEGFDTRNVTNRSECLQANYRWVRRKYNFDNLGQKRYRSNSAVIEIDSFRPIRIQDSITPTDSDALMSLFVLSSKDGWVNIMYDGLDAVAVDQQPIRNHNPWMLLYFISFLLIVSFFVLNMFVGVVVENFHKCRQDQEEEEARLREEKRQRRLEKRRRKALQRPYYADYSPTRLYIHTLCTNHYLDLFITIIIGINVLTMSMEHYNQPKYLEDSLKYCNYVFTLVFVIESVLKLVAFGFRRFFKDRWNQLDLAIVLLSVMGITLEEIDLNASLPINPTIIRIMRVLRIARVLKLLKMATGMRALLDTVVQALPQVGNLGLLFMLLFFIYAALGVELFGKLECSEENPCEGLSRHATFENFGMAFLTLFRVSTGDNWNGIMKDTLRECKSGDRCLSYLPLFSPLYFVTFVLVAQFVLVNVVVAVLMKHLEDSNKDACEEAEMEAELEAELQRNRCQNATASAGEVTGCPSLEQSDDLQDRNLLTVGKPSISRMLSLPNDSYMFYPKAGHKPRDQIFSKQQTIDHTTITGSSLSVKSELFEWESLLQVPKPPSGPTSHLEPLPPHHVTRQKSVRMLQRQEAIKSDSVDSASPGSMDNLFLHHSDSLKVPSIPLTGGSAPCSPLTTPPTCRSRTASVQTSRRVYSQRSIPSHRSTHTQPDTHTRTCNTHTSEEEVRHVALSIEGKYSAVRLLRRSHTLSSHVVGALCLKSQSQRSNSTGSDLRKYNSMDSTHGAWSNWPQKKSVPFKMQETEASLLRRKHKMSPPCVSTSADTPTFSETSPSGAVLKRRAPSFDSMLLQETLDLPDSLLVTKPLPQRHLSIHLSVPFEQSNNRMSGEDQSSHCVLLDP